MTRLTTRSEATAEAIRDRMAFTTYGALKATTGRPLTGSVGRLTGLDRERFYDDCDRITYTVWSYATPIAWWTPDTGWYKVRRRFTPTTDKHQSLLHLIPG